MKYLSIANSAAASDGGSLVLILECVNEGSETLVLNRSIAARGTTAYNTVLSKTGIVPKEEAKVLAEELMRLYALLPEKDKDPELHPVSEFVDALHSIK